MTLHLSAYSEAWPAHFETMKEALLQLFPEDVRAIEHVGSTAVPGLIAKPVIDIFMAVSPFRKVEFYEELLQSEGYHYVPTGMTERYLLARHTPEGVWTHNLHILPYSPDFLLRNEILFRNYLRKSPDLIQEYNRLKKHLSSMPLASLEDYTRAKTGFIQQVVDKARKACGLPRQNVWTMEIEEA
ncbi:GrpB family protein [Marinoscillum luteum]|uniref:GrpB family protein n=1 Tax=Marinoscillum luteum TaxID=861051 RepID=A0ABW7NDJ7_9BACT